MEIKQLEKETIDGSKLNLEALYHICPSCFTEVMSEDGKTIRRVINWNVLRELLGDDAVEQADEMYQFTWPGKQQARREAARPIDKTLRPVKEDSVDWDNTKNLYIEGDNLEVLKLLQKSYLGKVKMIYIDPPYNTGKDFVYNDDFSLSIEDYEEVSGNVDELGIRYRRNTDSNGRFHSDWCSMIYSRLLLAHSLLHQEGIILINIGEQEVDNLKKITNEIFGASNYIETYIWESTFRPDNSSKTMRRNAEYVLCAAKDKTLITRLRGLTKEKEGLPSLTKNSMNESVLKFPADTVITYLDNGIYEPGVKGSYTLLDEVNVKDGIITNSFRLKGRVIWGQENLDREITNGTEIIIKSEGFVPYTKKIGDSAMAPNKLIPNDVVGDILSSNAEMAQLFEDKVFSYPKPVTLLKYLIKYLDERDFICLDFFSGSSTTAEALIRVNLEDNGNRRYIMVQLPENLDHNLSIAEDSEKPILRNAIKLCDKLGFPHNITSVAKERLRRAGHKVKEEAGLNALNLDTGFRVFRIDESNFTNVNRAPNEYNQDQLDLFLDNVKADRTDLDLLFGAMLSWGVELSLPMTEETVDGCKVYTVNNGDLVACFSENVSDAVIKAMADKHPLRVLFRDSCFTQDDQKINLFEQFKQYLGWSEEVAIKNIRVI